MPNSKSSQTTISAQSKIELNPQFQEALDFLTKGNGHLFITGKAGTGKSTLLRHFRDQSKINQVTLAPTGVAAVNIQGQTIHSFFGFRPSTDLNEAKAKAQKLSSDRLRVIKAMDLIIIDEVSMVRADLLDMIDTFLQLSRKNPDPFGGIRMAFFGDLYQLPPVLQSSEAEQFRQAYETPYFFSSNVMKRVQTNNEKYGEDQLKIIELEKIYRQSDKTFKDVLNRIRTKEFTMSDLQILNNRVASQGKSTNDYIYITTTNARADEINQRRLEELEGDENDYMADVWGDFTNDLFPTEEMLTLKVDSRIMMLNNEKSGLWINGTLGYITKLNKDSVEVELDNGTIAIISPHSWEVHRTTYSTNLKTLQNEIIGAFTQLPLKLAWAITIHKSQGKTFDKVIIDLEKRAFAQGQTYVALSRCTTLEGIILHRAIEAADVRTDPRIKFFISGKRKYDQDNQPNSPQQPVSQSNTDKIKKLTIAMISRKYITVSLAATDGTIKTAKFLPKKVGIMYNDGIEFNGVTGVIEGSEKSLTLTIPKILLVS